MTTREEVKQGGGEAQKLSLKEILSTDLASSVVVFLVAVPLCMGIALASGAPIVSGLIAGVVGGLVVGLFGGAPLMVSGPAAGLAVMVFAMIEDLGFGVACAAFVAAGLLQIAFGTLRFARAALAISPAVIHGMLAGIGILIALSQIHIVLGGSPQSNAWTNLEALPARLAQLSLPATALGLLTIAALIAWPKVPVAALKKVPGPLAAVVIASAAAALFGADVARVQLGADFFGSLQLPQLPAPDAWGAFAVAAISLAVVASAESLLSAVATDKLHSGPRSKLDRELVAQGLANTASGMLGGLPVTGVIVRSAANIASGARTRWSAFMHGVWLLAFVSFLGGVAGLIPLAVLAGLLVHVGIKLVNPAHIRELKLRGELPIYVVTVAGVVGINLLAGIGLGIAASILRLLWRLGTVKVQVQKAGDVHEVRIAGTLTFVGVPKLASALAQVPAGSAVQVDVDVHTMDHSGYEALANWAQTHHKTGGRVEMEPLDELWRRRGTPAVEALPPIPAASVTTSLVSGGAH